MNTNEHRTCEGDPESSSRRGMTSRIARAIVPANMRQLVRTVATELPLMIRDAGDYIRDHSLPGPIRRFRVAGTTSRAQFIHVGQRGAEE